jgi:uncharacterized NAD(P)/FAD-binding protein YdhS
VKKVAVIGGGFSGTLAAIHLVRLAKTPLHVTVVNDGYPLGRGVAYSTKRAEHLLNVAARNMSALSEQPNHFLEWLGTRSEFSGVPEAVLREQFVPRRVYGDYLQGLFFWHSKASSQCVVDTVAGQAVDIVPDDADQGGIVEVDNGQVIEADKILLATGNPPPAELPLAQDHFEHTAYIRNPWLDWDSRLPDRRENIILIGTGLTTIDVFLTLRAQGWEGKIFAISRNGLLPLSHFKGIEYPEFPPEDPTSLSLTDLVTLLQTHCERLRQQGANPAIVVDKLRPFTQRIWQHLSVAEKQHFLRTWKTPWNVTRHRVAQSIHAQVTDAQARGQFEVVKGSIRQLSACGDRIDVSIASRIGQEQQILQGALVINCTGPQESFASTEAPLFQNLFTRGLAQPDDLDLGIQVAPDFAVIDKAGQRSDWLFAMGPLLKGTLWETTAVPELRIQAQRVAETILAALERRPAAVATGFQEMHADVLEYYI